MRHGHLRLLLVPTIMAGLATIAVSTAALAKDVTVTIIEFRLRSGGDDDLGGGHGDLHQR